MTSAQSRYPDTSWATNCPSKCFTLADGTPVTCIIVDGDGTIRAPEKEESELVIKKTYPFQGRQVPGQEIDFEATAEPWFHYKLADGSEMKVKLVLLNVVRLDEYNPQGDPFYQFNLQNIVSVNVPDELKRKAQ